METLRNIRTALMNVVVEAGKIIAMPFYKKVGWKYPQEALYLMPEGSVGKELANYLEKMHFELIEGYESHDVKHILTGYEMETLGEIRMQFYLCGNGNRTFPALFTMAFGLCLIPEHLFTFWDDYDQGKKSRSLVHMDYESVMTDSLSAARQALNIQHPPVEAKSVFVLVKQFRNQFVNQLLAKTI